MMATLPVLLCSSDDALAKSLEEAFGPAYRIVHSKQSKLFKRVAAMVVDTVLLNSDVVLRHARENGIPSFTVVGDYFERMSSLDQHDCDSFQRHFLDPNVLAARIREFVEE